MAATSTLQATSRESVNEVRDWFESVLRESDDSTLRLLGDELSAAARLLHTERVLRRHLADSSTAREAREGLVHRLFSAQVGAQALDTLRRVAAARWSRSLDLLNTVELLGRLPLLVVAERAGNADEIEDELFRFARILEVEPKLERLLTDGSTSARQRESLLDDLVADKVRPATRELLGQVVASPRGRRLDAVVAEIAELAAARREESVAHVRAAAELTAEQERRLADVLSRIYGRRVMVRVEIDPDVVGGLLIRIGDEVIDGSVASRLAKAHQELLG